MRHAIENYSDLTATSARAQASAQPPHLRDAEARAEGVHVAARLVGGDHRQVAAGQHHLPVPEPRVA